MTTLDDARRHLALTQLLLACHAPESLEEAVGHAEEAAKMIRGLWEAAVVKSGRRTEGRG